MRMRSIRWMPALSSHGISISPWTLLTTSLMALLSLLPFMPRPPSSPPPLGHSWLATHAKLHRFRQDDKCECGTKETVFHVLVDCPRLYPLSGEVRVNEFITMTNNDCMYISNLYCSCVVYLNLHEFTNVLLKPYASISV